MALPCYLPDERNLGEQVRGLLAEHRIEAAPDALDHLVANLGGDRALTGLELGGLLRGFSGLHLLHHGFLSLRLGGDAHGLLLAVGLGDGPDVLDVLFLGGDALLHRDAITNDVRDLLLLRLDLAVARDADQRHFALAADDLELARLLALLNVSMADAGTAIWESKFFYKFWRPVTGVREADAGTGPSGAGDDNPATAGDPTFTPLGAPASNLTGPNFTPPFPAYPSGHAGFGGALFETLRRFYGTDDIPFTFVSDEWNGVTRDREGNVRPLRPRTFASLSEAEEENGQSRIYLGIHWSFDKTEGIVQGNRVADYVYDNVYTKTR